MANQNETVASVTANKKRVALITGANQGIGLQVAKELVEHGYTVLLGSRNLGNGETAAKSIGFSSVRVLIN